ncbi:dTDP-glucose 4,6-dehydratase [Paenibacillus phyllosphaerae]|uniref:dTDP-glucose 4,6-dehydratase n=1 Tax=Paenibacillus phyllosphaerae TaxID=274593 RepID=A0A7W5ATM7_9BACL|nr:NAD-dependent epimerase/dehydratase family protein [Paenibacillus phyllosphaerae]MBB3108558.1 dTDP-glucose 4,6-dehydratase [Paenibacillus phyllosphaerae]
MKSILVTGASGFLGYNLSVSLHSIIGCKVVLHDKDDFCNRLMREPYTTILLSDLTLNSVTYNETFDYIIHLAAMPHVDFSFYHPEEVYKNNVISTQRVLELARKHDIPILIGSSVEVYGGEENRSYCEGDPYNPASPYAASKVACEVLTQTYIKCYGLKARIVRFTNLYGPWQLPDRIIPRNIARMLEGQSLDIQGHAVRDFLYIDDALEAIHTVMQYGQDGETYNISTNIGTTMREIGDLLVTGYGYPAPAALLEQEPTNSRGSSLVINSDKLRSLGWAHRTPLTDGLKRTYEWYKANYEWVSQFRDSYSIPRHDKNFIIDTARNMLFV